MWNEIRTNKETMINLYSYQIEAVNKMRNGCILCGGVGSGKSRTSLAYFYTRSGGNLTNENPKQKPPDRMKNPKDLYIITTAKKRDTLEWELELAPFLMSTKQELNAYDNTVVIDSWNNISKYQDVKGAFFIFDEQRVVGKGAWVKAFIKIAKENEWILLSATPGDTWLDYIPVFIANGFYKNRTEFYRQHVVWNPRTNFPKVDRYVNTGRLVRLRNNILVDMHFDRKTIPHKEDIWCDYDIQSYKATMRNRWDYVKNEPIQNAGGLCYALRRVVNSDPTRLEVVERIVREKKRAIIFYNFDYELEALKENFYEYSSRDEEIEVAEWNSHKHQPIPDSERWVYLVQYNAGSEGWNCIRTDTIIFFSQNYSYRTVVQASGRIDRLNTPYTDLYYYHLKSRSGIDLAIAKALKDKKKFNEYKFVNG